MTSTQITDLPHSCIASELRESRTTMSNNRQCIVRGENGSCIYLGFEWVIYMDRTQGSGLGEARSYHMLVKTSGRLRLAALKATYQGSRLYHEKELLKGCTSSTDVVDGIYAYEHSMHRKPFEAMAMRRYQLRPKVSCRRGFEKSTRGVDLEDFQWRQRQHIQSILHPDVQW
jgi:hypothetical protein